MTAPATREFETFAVGEIRDLCLDVFRAGLRQRVNPETGTLFTDDEIARATQAGSRWYREAQAIDDFGQAEQRRGLFLADQLQIDRACTAWLENYHAPLWDPDGRLPATRATGVVRVVAPEGTIVLGSTTVPDAGAYWCSSASGQRYQITTGGTVDESGLLDVPVSCVDAGAAGNDIEDQDVLTWITKASAMDPQCTAQGDFSGGTDVETDAEWAQRMLAAVRYKQGGGNDAQQRAWARRSSNAIEDAFVYPCAFGAGSLLIALTAKRANRVGPEERIPGNDLLTAAIAYLTPPASPVEPSPPRILVTTTRSVAADVSLKLQMAYGVSGGWADAAPFPTYHATAPYVAVVTDQTHLTLTCSGDASRTDWADGVTRSGTDVPRIMIWHAEESEWEELLISSITRGTGGTSYTVVLSAATSWTLVGSAGMVVSPYTDQHAAIASALAAYFDARGPGELFAATDRRAGRCRRFPPPENERPYRASNDIGTWVLEACSAAAVDLGVLSTVIPDYPSDLTTGPGLLTLDHAGVYAL
jgi:uncharacterized phage protein gp47/JayE